ncbi:HIT family protein [Salinispora arenicola]|uniref:HIT family protein n=1 Tax=Salinispora arenicola TaxID=168697 RepID=UPI00036636E6|nr:HIT domain-containing protein [Salinispora arenicola]
MNISTPSDWRRDRVGAAERGENPTVITRMRTGWAVMGDTQHLPGYVLLLYAGTADQLTDLPVRERGRFLTEMSLLGEATLKAISARDSTVDRLNYEILGNSWHHLHAHIHPRYSWEPMPWRTGPVWRYDASHRDAPEHALGPRHEELKEAIAAELRTALLP